MTVGKILGSGPMRPRTSGPGMERTTRLPVLANKCKPARRARSQRLHRLDSRLDRLGVSTMLHESDKRWLREAYPGLFPTGNKIVGTIEFRASYDRQCNRFFILGSAVTEQKEAVALSGAFQIRIEK